MKGRRSPARGEVAGPPARPAEHLDADPLDELTHGIYNQASSGTGLPYQIRELMASAPQIAPIIQKRCNDVSRFGVVNHARNGVGFRFGLRDTRRSATAEEEKQMERLERFFSTCGAVHGHRDMIKRQFLPAFLHAYTRDMMVHDQGNAEIVPDKAGRPSYWEAVDASTIRRTPPKLITHPSGALSMEWPDEPAFVQIIDSKVVAEFDLEEMMFSVRRTRTNIKQRKYGFPELDELAIVVTALMWSLDYNANYFKNGVTTKGLLTIKGNLPKNQQRALRRMWQQMLRGVYNAWRTPIMTIPTKDGDVKWVSLAEASNRDMEWGKFNDFLLWLACALFGMDPIEIGMKFNSSAGSPKALFEGNKEQSAQFSMENGLEPILRRIQTDFNKHLVWPWYPDLEFQFVGLRAKGEMELAELNTKRLKWMMIDEIRESYDLAPMPDGLGQMLDSQIWMQLEAQKRMEDQQGGGFGGGDEGLPQIEGDDDLDALYAEMLSDEADYEPAGIAEPREGVAKSWRLNRVPVKWRTAA
jgi:hypothetical protein